MRAPNSQEHMTNFVSDEMSSITPWSIPLLFGSSLASSEKIYATFANPPFSG